VQLSGRLHWPSRTGPSQCNSRTQEIDAPGSLRRPTLKPTAGMLGLENAKQRALAPLNGRAVEATAIRHMSAVTMRIVAATKIAPAMPAAIRSHEELDVLQKLLLVRVVRVPLGLQLSAFDGMEAQLSGQLWV
jgi:hypothetical protein